MKLSYMRFMTGGACSSVVSMNLAEEAFRRNDFMFDNWLLANTAWIDGGYCIDAPGTCLAGSMLNLGCGGESFPFPSFYERF